MLKDWVGSNSQFKLLYRASRDNFTFKAFHEKCDNQGPTLTIIKSDLNGKVFGGYTSVSWRSPSSRTYVKDEEAFLFSLTRMTKIPQLKKGEKTIEHIRSNLVTFGGGGSASKEGSCDIQIVNNSHMNYCYHFNSGKFKYPEGKENDSSFLCGGKKILVVEIETYQVIFP